MIWNVSRSPFVAATSGLYNSFRNPRFLLGFAVLVVMPAFARADSLSVGADMEFSNGQAPASAAKPWLLMTITDNGPDSVIFKLDATHLTGSESVSEFSFNLDPALLLDLGNLTFTSLIKTGTFDTPDINQGANAYKADGDGYFDLQLAFTTGGNDNKNFTSGDSIQYTINGAGISVASFNFKSNSGGGDSGPFTTAAHIQNTTGVGHGGSGWVADSTGGSFHFGNVPEPSSFVLAAGGIFGALMLVRRRR